MKNELRKIVSLVSLNRGIRDGEIDGVDYNFVSTETLKKKHRCGDLMQYTTVGDVHYGYEKSSFENVEELIVLCAESGAGKDTVMKYISKEYGSEFNGKTAFLFSVPNTLHLFEEYAKEHNIVTTFLFLDVEKEERFRRIIAGDIKNKYPRILSVEANIVFDALDLSVIERARRRVERFNVPFAQQISSLRRKGLAIATIHGTSMGLASTARSIMGLVRVSREVTAFKNQGSCLVRCHVDNKK